MKLVTIYVNEHGLQIFFVMWNSKNADEKLGFTLNAKKCKWNKWWFLTVTLQKETFADCTSLMCNK